MLTRIVKQTSTPLGFHATIVHLIGKEETENKIPLIFIIKTPQNKRQWSEALSKIKKYNLVTKKKMHGWAITKITHLHCYRCPTNQEICKYQGQNDNLWTIMRFYQFWRRSLFHSAYSHSWCDRLSRQSPGCRSEPRHSPWTCHSLSWCQHIGPYLQKKAHTG